MNDKTTSGKPVMGRSLRDQQRADALRKNLQRRKGQVRSRDSITSSTKEK